jgi:transposase
MVLMERNVPSEVEDIARVIRSTGVVVEAVALETGNLTPWLTVALRAEGFRVVVLEARQVKTMLSSLRNKTDRNDARGIAQILRTGWYREVHVKSLESQRLKTLLAARKALSRRHIDLENEIRGLMKVYGRKLTSVFATASSKTPCVTPSRGPTSWSRRSSRCWAPVCTCTALSWSSTDA